MRVLTFLHSFEPGGVERDALRLNDEWAKLGADVHIVLGRRDGRLVEEAPDLAYTVLQQGSVSTASLETLWMIAKLPGAIRAIKPDVIFCAGNTYSVVAVALRLLLGHRCPPIILKVSNDLQRRDLPAMMRWAYHLWLRIQAPAFTAIVAMAEPARGEIEQIMRVSTARISVINNASLRQQDAAQFAAMRDATVREHQGRNYLAVGRLVPQKNFALLLRAFAQIAQPSDQLTLVGEGGARRALENLGRSLGVAQQVSMPGHMNPLHDQFATADAFILSSDYEGLGVVVVEALAAGTPVVATDCCVNMAMLVADAGLLVPIKTVVALAEAMDRITTTPVDVAAMRARAQGFTVEGTAPAWISLFQSAANGAAPQGRIATPIAPLPHVRPIRNHKRKA
jgi:glycosyltransferase involved in cell wall biosynthesis